MAYLTTLTLDNLQNTHIMETKLLPTGRLDAMSIFLRKPFLIALASYLQDRGYSTSDNPHVKFQYVVTDSDVDFVASELMNDLETWAA